MVNATRGRVRVEHREPRKSIIDAGSAGFTLVEMLVVLTIIGLIVGIVGPRVFNQLAGAKARTAHIQIESFKNALDLFMLDAGRFPTSSEGLAALMIRPSSVSSWNGPYLKSGAVPHDPWNNPYVYRAPGQSGRSYDIVSFGAGGRDSEGHGVTQITSW
jgi:general secretion pathway protein G